MAPDKLFFSGYDMLGRKVELPSYPKRIVSIVPSQTELLCHLGLRKNLVGITKFCDYPAGLKSEIALVGGTKSVNTQRLLALTPDLVIANKEENTMEIVHALQQQVPVWVSDVRSLEQSFQMIAGISDMLGIHNKGVDLVEQIKSKFSGLALNSKPLRTAYFIWKDPWMLAGKDTFIDAMMQSAGLENVVPLSAGRYPEMSANQIIELQPELLLFSSEPFPFTPEKIKHFDGFVDIPCKCVDGKAFSWYGSSMLDFVDYVNLELER